MLYKTFGGGENETDGSLIANEIHWINEFSDATNPITEIEVKINSMGGDVQQGLSVCDAILTSEIPVTTNIVGMAYSMAGVVAMCGQKRKMSNHATFMMHNVGGGDNVEVLNLLTNSLAKIFEGTTALTLDKCRELMNMETWLDADECLKMGLVDEITPTKLVKPKTASMDKMVAFYNSITNKNIKPKKIIKMDKVTSFLNLSTDADEASIVDGIQAIATAKENAVNEVVELKAEMVTLKAENDSNLAKVVAFEDIAKEAEVTAKEAVLVEAVNAGKIKEADKAVWIENPINAVDLKNLFGTLTQTPAFVPAVADATNDAASERAKWNFTDWSKNDPKGLAEIEANNKPEFERLIATISTGIKSKK